jgi:hypothetical protein
VYSNNGETFDLENGGKKVADIERKLMHEIAGHAAPFVKQQQNNAVYIENIIMLELFFYPMDLFDNPVGCLTVLRFFRQKPYKTAFFI